MSRDCGIVLIKTKDPLGRIVQELCNTLGYSTAGFYIDEEMYIIDVLDGKSPTWTDTSTMTDLMSNKHIDKIVISPISNFSDFDLIKHWKCEELEPNLAIKSIITRNINNTIYWINKLVLLMHGNVNFSTIDSCIKETVLNSNNYKDKILVLKEFTEHNKLTETTREELMRAYIISFPNIGKSREIELSKKNKLYDKQIIYDLGVRMEYFINAFSHMLAKNEDGILTRVLNILSISQNISNDKEEILFTTNKNLNLFISFFQDSLENGLINYDKYLYQLFKIINNIKQYGELSDLNFTHNPKIKLLGNNKHLVVSVNDEEIDHSNYRDSIKNLRDIINGIKMDIKNDDNVIIDLNSLISNIDDLCSTVKIGGTSKSINLMEGNFSIPCAVVVTNNNYERTEIKIDTSDRYMTTRSNNIENYTDDELKVIMNKLENYEDGDYNNKDNDEEINTDDFQALKLKIIKRLSKK